MPLSHFIVFCLLSLNFGVFSQQRIGVDLSSRMDNLILYVHYQKVLKNHLSYSDGVFIGGNGRIFINNDPNAAYFSQTVLSPYFKLNRTISDSTGNYSIFDYN